MKRVLKWMHVHAGTMVFACFALVVIAGFGSFSFTIHEIHHQQDVACQRSSDARIVNRNLWFGLLDQFPDSPQVQSIRSYVDNALPIIRC